LVEVSLTIVLNALSNEAINAESFVKSLEHICVYLEWRSNSRSTYSRGSWMGG
jgi:hypothetical protein